MASVTSHSFASLPPLQITSHDLLGLGHKLHVLTVIQDSLRASVGLDVCVVRAEASWPCTIQVSWISGSFAGGAAVVTLSNLSKALVLLAGSSVRTSTSSGVAGTASPSSGAVGFRIVSVVHSTQVLAYQHVDISLLCSARRAWNASNPTRSSNDDSREESQDPAAPKYVTIGMAFQENEKPRYVFLERCPLIALASAFTAVKACADATPLESGQRPSCVPLGSLGAMCVDASATAGDTKGPGISAPLKTSTEPSSFSNLQQFRNAILQQLTRGWTVGGVEVVSVKDFGYLQKAELGMEVLWAVSGCARVHMSIETNVKAAFLTPAVMSAALQVQSRSAGGSASSPGGPSAAHAAPSPAADSTSSRSTSSTAALDTKERCVAICGGGIVLLKRKSAFPPPLWCFAISWYQVSRLVAAASTIRVAEDIASRGTARKHAAAAADGTQVSQTGVSATSITVVVEPRLTAPHPVAAALSSASLQSDFLSMTTHAYSHATFCASDDEAKQRSRVSISAASKSSAPQSSGADDKTNSEQQFVVYFATPTLAGEFVDCCRRAYTEFTGMPLHVVASNLGGSASPAAPKGGDPNSTVSPNRWVSMWPLAAADSEWLPRRYPAEAAVLPPFSMPNLLPSLVHNVLGVTHDSVVLAHHEAREASQLTDCVTRQPAVFLLLLQWTLSAAPSPPWQLQSALCSTLVRWFAQLPGVAIAEAKLGGSESARRPVSRVFELVVAAVELNASLSGMQVCSLPPLPGSYTAVFQAKLASVSLPKSHEDTVDAASPPASPGTPPSPSSVSSPKQVSQPPAALYPAGQHTARTHAVPSLSFFVCRWAVVITCRALWNTLSKHVEEATASQRNFARGGVMAPPWVLTKCFEHLPRDAASLTDVRGALSGMIEHYTAASSRLSATASLDQSHASAMQLLAVIVVDILVDTAVDVYMSQTGATQWAALRDMFAGGASGSASSSSAPAITVSSAQQWALEWLFSVVGKHPTTRPNGGAALAPCASLNVNGPFSLHTLVDKMFAVDALLSTHGIHTEATQSSHTELEEVGDVSETVADDHSRDDAVFVCEPRRSNPLGCAIAWNSPVRILVDFFRSSGMWKRMFLAVCSAPLGARLLRRLAASMTSVAMDAKASQQLLSRRHVAVQTLRSSDRDKALLHEHMLLRSQLTLSSGADTESTVNAPSAPSRDAPPQQSIPQRASSDCLVVDDDPDTNKNLLKRVLTLEKQLLSAHERISGLQDDLAAAHAIIHKSNEGAVVEQWQCVANQMVHSAQEKIALRLQWLEGEREALRREQIVNDETQGRFKLTSALLMALMGLP